MKASLNIVCSVIITAIVVWFAGCRFQGRESGTIKTTDTVYIPGDSIPYMVEVKVPVPYDSIVTDTQYYPNPVDTSEILKKYYTRYFYTDTIADSSVIAIIHEEITRNLVADRQVWFQNLRPHAVTYTTINEPAPKLYAGIVASNYGKIGIGPGFIYSRKNDAFTLGVDLVNTGITAGYYMKFK